MIICQLFFLLNFIDRIKTMLPLFSFLPDRKPAIVSKRVHDQLLYAIGRNIAIEQLAERKKNPKSLQKSKKTNLNKGKA